MRTFSPLSRLLLGLALVLGVLALGLAPAPQASWTALSAQQPDLQGPAGPPSPPADARPPASIEAGQRPSLAPAPRVAIGNETLPLTTRMAEAGPLFELSPLARRLGGAVEDGAFGASWELELLGTRYTFGAGTSAVIRDGKTILDLSQAPQSGASGPMVPLDFLQLTFGEQLELVFDWDLRRGLDIQRPVSRELLVVPELVHLQGTTTLVFEFSEAPRYRIDERPSTITIDILGDHLVNEWGTPAGDDLVRRVAIGAQSIQVRLAPGMETRHYVVERPFRLVFDVYPAAGGGSEFAEDAGDEAGLKRPQRRAGIRTIVLDPGHGGSETGAIGASGVAEKDLTLNIAKRLARRLEQRLAVNVVLTRDEDTILSLEARTALANENKADLFVSLHVNSSYGASAQGAETFILSGEASDALAADAAAAENTGSLAADPLYDLQLILWDLSQSHHLAESLRFATLVQEELNSALELRDRGVKQAPFRVLMGAAMPATLVELGFLSNPEEEAKLQEPGYQTRLVDALTRAFTRYKALVEQGEPTQDEAAP